MNKQATTAVLVTASCLVVLAGWADPASVGSSLVFRQRDGAGADWHRMLQSTHVSPEESAPGPSAGGCAPTPGGQGGCVDSLESPAASLYLGDPITFYLPLVARYSISATAKVVDVPLEYATAESWSWQSCQEAHSGDEGGWWPESDRGFVARVSHGGDDPWAWWDIYRGFAWTAVAEQVGEIVSASLRMPLCYATEWPTQSGEVALHWGTWPGPSPLEEDGLAAWRMHEPAPFAVLKSEELPRIYGRTSGGTCAYEAPIYVEISLPLERVQPGQAVQFVARDGRDVADCAMEPGSWGVVMVEPGDAHLRLRVRKR